MSDSSATSDNNALQFCQFSSQELTQLHDILLPVFQMNMDEIEHQYANLRSTFDCCMWPPIKDSIPRSCFESKDIEFRETYQKSPCVAIDLPSTFELGSISSIKGEKPTVFIVGQDPKSDRDSQNISLGTPYGLQYRGCREEFWRTKRYFEMIQVLLKWGYKVYLTDIFKVWVCNPAKPYTRRKLPKVDQKRFLDVLKSEIETIKPEKIITWGRESEKVINSLSIEAHINFPHPSGAANGAWKKLLNGKSPTQTNKLEYWKSSLEKVLQIS